MIYSIFGLLVFGMGLSILGEAIILKYKQSDNWFVWGTLALITTNSGLCLFGQAVIEKIKLNLQTKDSWSKGLLKTIKEGTSFGEYGTRINHCYCTSSSIPPMPMQTLMTELFWNWSTLPKSLATEVFIWEIFTPMSPPTPRS